MKKDESIDEIIPYLFDETEQSAQQIDEDIMFFSHILPLALSGCPLSLKVKEKLFKNEDPSSEEFIQAVYKMKPERFYRIVRKAKNELEAINKQVEESNKLIEENDEPIKKTRKFIDKIKKCFRINKFYYL